MPANVDFKEDVFVRIKGDFSQNFELTIYGNSELSEKSNRISLFLGFVSGIIIAMLLYNFILFLVLRDRTYLLYVLYISIMLLYQSGVTGTGRIINTEIGDFIINNVLLFGFLAIAGHLLFSWNFLNVRENVSKMIKLYYVYWLYCALGVFLVLIGNTLTANKMAFLGSSFVVIVLFSTVYFTTKSGSWVSKYYLLAVFTLAISVVVFAMRGLGFIEPSLISSYIVISSTAVESILFSFALAERIRRLRKQNVDLQLKEKELSRLAITDEMTGLFNRRYFEQILDYLTKGNNNNTQLFSILLIDIDYFKKINDTYGHQKGDEFLVELAEVLQRNIRNIDYAFRIGGEEFAVIIKKAQLTEAYNVAERIRKDYMEHDFLVGNDKVVKSTISIGVAELKEDETGFELFGRVDALLYEAKNTGRNKTKI